MLATLAITTSQLLGSLAVVAFVVICIVLVLTILIQKPQGGGLAGAFGSSAGSGQTAFGAKTGDALTVITIVVFALFIGFAILLNHLQRPAVIDPAAPAAQAAPGTDPGNSGTPMPATGDAAPSTPFPAATPTPAPTAPAVPEGQAPAPAPTPAPVPAPAPGQ